MSRSIFSCSFPSFPLPSLLQPKPKTIDSLTVAALQLIWEELPQERINKAVVNFIKRLIANMAVAANCDHVEHLQ